MNVVYVCLLLFSFQRTLVHSEIIRVGGLFDPSEETEKRVFRTALRTINSSQRYLPNFVLVANVQDILVDDCLETYKKACSLLRSGVAVIFGPTTSKASTAVRSICDAKRVPHVETRWEPQSSMSDHTINLYPSTSLLNKALVDLVISLEWGKFTILYEGDQGLTRMEGFVETMGSNTDVRFNIKRLPELNNYRALLQSLKHASVTNMLVICETSTVIPFLMQAMQVSMTTKYHSYIFTSMDLHSLDLTHFSHSRTNITGFRIVNPEHPAIVDMTAEWTPGSFSLGSMETQSALLYDGVHLFAKALTDLSQARNGIEVKTLPCEDDSKWSHGSSIVNYMKMVSLDDGITGPIKFDERGGRIQFKLDLVQASRTGADVVGFWTPSQGINFTSVSTPEQSSIADQRLTVTTALTRPYTMKKESAELLVGNDKFEGYCIDLIHEISKELGFNYTIKLVNDGNYGSRDPETGQWNGMIKELLDGVADMAVVDLTITYDREKAVDFSMPFMNLGISILYLKPQKSAPNLFSFLSPLSYGVWICMAIAFVGVSVLMFILARFTPFETPDPGETENKFNLLNSMWFAIGSLMQQGCDFAPQALSTRMVAGIWWFFTLILVSSYTANLAAFLTVENLETTISSAEDLAQQTKIKYGSLATGSTTAFFKRSTIHTFRNMWNFMESSRPSVFTKSNDQGVQKVLDGDYAYLMESTSIEYETARNCKLTKVGGLLDHKGYGIALPPKSPHLREINNAILSLQESNVLHKLKEKWWQQKSGGQCKDPTGSSSGGASELTLANVGGVFVVLMGGVAVACVLNVTEFVWNARKLTVDQRESTWDDVAKEVRAGLSLERWKHKSPPSRDSNDGESDTMISSSNASTFPRN